MKPDQYYGGAANPIDLDAPGVLPTPGALDLDDPRVVAYYGAPPAQATPGAIDLDAPLPYQPNPGLPGYNPNPGAATSVAPQPPPQPAVLGAQPPSPTTNAFRTGAQLSSAVAPAPPAPALGPTPADDAAFEAYKAKVGAPKPAPAGAAAGAAANPLGGVNGAILGAYDAQKAAREREANAEADKLHLMGEGKAAIARQQETDAQLAQLESDEATKRFDGHMQEMQRQLDEVRSKKVDPGHYMSDRGALGAFAAVLGGVIGGVYQGINKLQKNPFLEELNAQIDRQMTADEKNLANERTAVGEQANLLAMNRAIYKDNQLAKMQARSMYLEAAKSELEAQVADSDSEIAKARAQQGITAIDLQQQQVKKGFIEEARRQAAAGAAAMYARQKERQATYKDFFKEGLDKGLTPAQAEFEALRQTSILYAPQLVGERPPEEPGGAEYGLSARGRNEIAVKRHEAQQEADAQIAALKAADLNAITAGSRVGTYWAGSGLPDVAGSRQAVQARDAFNAQVRMAFDAAYRSTTGAAPTQFVVEHGADPFLITDRDGPEDAARKIASLEKFVVDNARAKGAHGVTPQERAKALGEKPIK